MENSLDQITEPSDPKLGFLINSRQTNSYGNIFSKEMKKFSLITKDSLKRVIFVKEVEFYLKKNYWKDSFEVKNISKMVKEIKLEKGDKLHPNYFKNYPIIMVKLGKLSLTSGKRNFAKRTQILFLVEKEIKRKIIKNVISNSPQKRRSSILALGLFNKLNSMSPFMTKKEEEEGKRLMYLDENYDVTHLEKGEILHTEILNKFKISLRADEDSSILLFDLTDFKDKLIEIDSEKEKKNILHTVFAYDFWIKFEYGITKFKNLEKKRNLFLKKLNEGKSGKIYIIQKGSVKISKRMKLKHINENNFDTFFDYKEQFNHFTSTLSKLNCNLEKSVDILYYCKGEVIGIEEFYENDDFKYDFEFKIDSQDCLLYELDAKNVKEFYPNSVNILIKRYKEEKEKWMKLFNMSIKKWLKEIISSFYLYDLKTSLEDKNETMEHYNEKGKVLKILYKEKGERISNFYSKSSEKKICPKVRLKDLSLIPPRKEKMDVNNYDIEMRKNRYKKTTRFLKKIIHNLKGNTSKKKNKILKQKKYVWKKGENSPSFFITESHRSLSQSRISKSKQKESTIRSFFKTENILPLKIKSIQSSPKVLVNKYGDLSSFRVTSTPKVKRSYKTEGSRKLFHFLPKFKNGNNNISRDEKINLKLLSTRSYQKTNYTKLSNLDLLTSRSKIGKIFNASNFLGVKKKAQNLTYEGNDSRSESE